MNSSEQHILRLDPGAHLPATLDHSRLSSSIAGFFAEFHLMLGLLPGQYLARAGQAVLAALGSERIHPQ